MSKHDYLWNDLTIEERKRLSPHITELQVLHIRQCKHKAQMAHERHMKELDAWIKNLEGMINRP